MNVSKPINERSIIFFCFSSKHAYKFTRKVWKLMSSRTIGDQNRQLHVWNWKRERERERACVREIRWKRENAKQSVRLKIKRWFVQLASVSVLLCYLFPNFSKDCGQSRLNELENSDGCAPCVWGKRTVWNQFYRWSRESDFPNIGIFEGKKLLFAAYLFRIEEERANTCKHTVLHAVSIQRHDLK